MTFNTTTTTTTSAMVPSRPPTLEEEHKIINALLQKNHALYLGMSWYVISKHWWDQWMGIDDESQAKKRKVQDELSVSEQPKAKKIIGAIDNTVLISQASLTSGTPRLLNELLEEKDYKLIPEAVWDVLHEWYGGGPTIERKVEKALDRKLFIEVYPLNLRFSYLSKTKELQVSRTLTVDSLKRKIRDLFQIEPGDPITLLNEFHELQLPESTLEEECQEIIVKTPSKKSTFGSTSSTFPSYESQTSTYPATRSSFLSNTNASFHYSSPSSFGGSTRKGLCGLMNLGNTCFMNSAIQCLSNTEPLTKYFLENKYLKDINTTNPLGMEGKLAMSYGSLIKEMWSGDASQVVPRQVKSTIAKFASQFSGIGQHDTQELLAFLLDGLHEDLNLVKNKPYIENKESDGRPDWEVAEEAWQNHLKRNNSIIVDLFQGQFKSRLVCPSCGKISVTFDPFMYLSLPLANRSLKVKVFQKTKEIPTIYNISVPPKGKISDLRAEVAKLTSLPPSSIVFAEIFQNKFQKIFSDDESIREASFNGSLYAFEMTDSNDIFYPETIVLPRRSHVFFGDPFFVQLSRSGTSYRQLYSKIWRYVSRILKSEFVDGKEDANSPVEDSMDTDDDMKEAKGESYYHFCIFNNRTREERDVADIDEPIKFKENEWLIINWDKKAYNEVIDKVASDKVIIGDTKKSTYYQYGSELKLLDCLEQFLTQERLSPSDQWYCPSCKEFKQATKKLDLWKLPEILVVHLKRFSAKLFREKLDTYVHFPLNGLDLTEFVLNPLPTESYVYDLYATCNHYGSVGCGHYTAYAKNVLKDQWYQFDDSSVTQMPNESKVQSKGAYVLFYKRRSPQGISSSL